MKDKDTRKLIFVNEEAKLRFFLSKGPDVPTYVEYGAADIGVAGEDTILEENRKIYEVLDLGFGACRMCVCGPPQAGELLGRRGLIRVASNRRNHKIKRLHRAGADSRAFRGHCRYRGNRLHAAGKRTGSA